MTDERLLRLIGASACETQPLDRDALVCEAYVNALLALDILGLDTRDFDTQGFREETDAVQGA